MTIRSEHPTAAELLDARFEQHALETWTSFPGRIQGYNPDTQTADIVPLLRVPVPQADGTYTMEDAPVVPSVAIIQPRVRGWFMAFPVQDGDTVLCVVTDGDIGTWRRGSGDLVSPRDLRRHHLAHAVAFVGLYTHHQPLAHVPPRQSTAVPADSAMMLGSDAADGTRVAFKLDGSLEVTRGNAVALRLDPDGTVHIGGAAGDQFVALANLVDTRLGAIRTAFNTHVHAETGTNTAVPTTPMPAIGSVAATKAKAT